MTTCLATQKELNAKLGVRLIKNRIKVFLSRKNKQHAASRTNHRMIFQVSFKNVWSGLGTNYLQYRYRNKSVSPGRSSDRGATAQ